MATFTHPTLPVRRTGSGRSARSTARTARTARTTRTPSTVSAEPGLQRQADEPRRAASVLPVLLAFGALVALSVGAAYFGREAITLLAAFLQPS